VTRAPQVTPVEPGFSGKVFLRQEEFRAQRGLPSEPRELSLDEGSESPYLLGTRQREALLAAAPPAPDVVWRSLGPAGIPNGQTYGSGLGSATTVAGRVSAIAVDPDKSQHLLVGSAGGGVWETKDGGATWAPRTDDQPTLSIGALAFDPVDASKVYAGTGEGNTAYEYALLGQGLLVSGDGGTTWTPRAREIFAGFGFYRLAVDPHDGARLLAATTGAAVASSDAGTKWSLLYPDRTWDLSLAYLGEKPEVLLATPGGLFAVEGTAAPVQVELPGFPGALDRDRERMAVAHVTSDPGQAFVFAAFWGKPHLWHRPAAGEPFAPVWLPSFPVGEYVKHVLSVDQAAYDWYVAAPRSGEVYLGAIELVKGERSGDGWTWSDISSRQQHGDSIHPDQHTMAFDPEDPKVVYAGNDGGIFRSADGGGSWQSLNAGLAISEVEYMTQRPDDPGWILAGLQDNGTVRRRAEGEWAQVVLGDGGDCGIDTTTPDVCFSSQFYMYLERSLNRGDPGSWEEITPPGSDGFEKLFYPPLEVNGEMVVKAGEVVCLSADAGESWEEVPLPQTVDGLPSMASGLAIPSTTRVLVGTIWGDVFRIDAGGAGWSAPIKLTRPAGGRISDLLVGDIAPHRYWVTVSNHPGAVFRSDDEGATWANVTANLPSIPVNAIVADPSNRDRVWVACDVGVFESADAGGSWAVFGTGLPNALAEDLLFYRPDRLLRVGTRSRGVWEVSVG
jgi:photosystem II stability/assembly factor-like uncharacterized protein